MDNKLEIDISFLHNYKSDEELKKEDFQESKNIFSIFDMNEDGKIDKNEITNIFQQFTDFSEKNTNDTRNFAYAIFDEIEAENLINEGKDKTGKTYKELGVTVSEVFKFLNTLMGKSNNTDITDDNFAKISTERDPELSQEIEEEITELNDEQIEIAQKLSDIPERKDNQFSEQECKLLAQLTPEELDKAKEFFFIKSRKTQLSAKDIIFLVRDYKEKYKNVSSENYNRLPEFLNLTDEQGNNLHVRDCMLLLDGKTNEEVDKTLALLHSRNKEYSLETAQDINYTIKSKSSYLYNLMLNNRDLNLALQDKIPFINSDIRDVKLDGKIYRFILGQEFPEEITYEENGNEVIQTIHNPNLNQTQIITYETSEDEKFLEKPQKIETRYYDNNGNIEYTEFYENGTIPGTKNIYTIDKNGKRTDIQTGHIDSETGIQSITKNFISTNGVATKYTLTANPNTNEYELNYEISNPDGTEPAIIYSKTQSLKKTDENSFTYTKAGKTYNIKIEKDNESENGIIQITDVSQNKTFDIDLNKLFQHEQDKIIAQRFVRMPAELLIFLSEHPLDNINYGIYEKEGNGHFDKENNFIELGTQTKCKTDIELQDTVFSILMHEFGHFLDFNIGENINSLSTNEDFINCFKAELAEFKAKHNSEEQNAIGYFSGATTMEGFTRGCQEAVAETNMLLNTATKQATAERAYYFQRYFPKTIAFIANMIQDRLQK